jgi:uncharacterized membrane protein
MNWQLVLKFAIVLALIDSIWINYSSKWHTSIFQSISRTEIRYRKWPVVLFYLLTAYAWYYLLYKHKLSVKEAALHGLITYATYDLTMLAVFKEYPVSFAAADIAWGTAAFALAHSIVTKM